MSIEKSSGSAVRLLAPLFIPLLFIGLKLGKVIDWSWWWVLAPIWIPLVVAVLIFVCALIVFSVTGDERK